MAEATVTNKFFREAFELTATAAGNSRHTKEEFRGVHLNFRKKQVSLTASDGKRLHYFRLPATDVHGSGHIMLPCSLLKNGPVIHTRPTDPLKLRLTGNLFELINSVNWRVLREVDVPENGPTLTDYKAALPSTFAAEALLDGGGAYNVILKAAVSALEAVLNLELFDGTLGEHSRNLIISIRNKTMRLCVLSKERNFVFSAAVPVNELKVSTSITLAVDPIFLKDALAMAGRRLLFHSELSPLIVGTPDRYAVVMPRRLSGTEREILNAEEAKNKTRARRSRASR